MKDNEDLNVPLFEIDLSKNNSKDGLSNEDDNNQGNLGNYVNSSKLFGNLAARMRPNTLDEFAGQAHLLDSNAPLKKIIAGQSNTSLILYGPPGTGKTTLAFLVSKTMKRDFVALSAINSNVSDIKAIIKTASRKLHFGTRTILFIDEIHRFSKAQQDSLLGAVETGVVQLIAATTENPSFSVIAPLISRLLVLQLEPLDRQSMALLLNRALMASSGLRNYFKLSEAAEDQIIRLADGDARKALNILEASALSIVNPERLGDNKKEQILIDIDTVDKSVAGLSVRYDKNGDQHYDVVSAFIKSIRGNDVDAALHYLARMIVAGEDPRFIARRLIIIASEDIGMADSFAIEISVAAANAVDLIGMPEARINLAHATVYLALAPKSNSIIKAIDKAIFDIKSGGIGQVPRHLRDGHYQSAKKLGNAVGYIYPHDYPNQVVAQQYLPDELRKKRYYLPGPNGRELNLRAYVEDLRKRLDS